MRQYAVIGLGKFGASVACTLAKLGHQVLAVDIDEDKVQQVADGVTHAVQADATDEDILRAIGIRNFDVVIVTIGHDVLSSILTCLILKDMGVTYVVGKAHDELHGKLLEKIGVEQVVYPERDMGARLAATLTSSNILEVIELSPDYDVVEITASSELIGRTLRELNLRAKLGVNVVAIRSTDNKVKVSPGPDDLIRKGDVLLALGTTESLGKLGKLG
ncbi:MAG: TrkA family potassium uptake protein [Firmicutes bacterium]|nr:TrkA family potassium uptake protein [Bacillota bacterium]